MKIRWLHRSARFCCWKAMGRFRSNFLRRIRIRNQNQPITSGLWDIWGYVLGKSGFSLLLKLSTWRKKFFWFFSQMSSFSTTLFLQNELLSSHERFFFTKTRPYQVLTFIRTTLWVFIFVIENFHYFYSSIPSFSFSLIFVNSHQRSCDTFRWTWKRFEDVNGSIEKFLSWQWWTFCIKNWFFKLDCFQFNML